MGLRVPQNQIIKNKYTAGKEYMFVKTYREYQGYYYEMNGKIFAGKDFNPIAPELMPIQSKNVNTLLTNPSTYIYGKVSGTKIVKYTPTTQIYTPDPINNGYVDRYFVQKITVVPIIIKEVNQESYENAKLDPLYKTVTIKWDKAGNNMIAIKEAEKQMPGIGIYLESEESAGDSFGN